MAIEIPDFENLAEKIIWLREKTVSMSAQTTDPALEAERDTLGPILLAAIAEAQDRGIVVPGMEVPQNPDPSPTD